MPVPLVFRENASRYALLPIQHPKLWDCYKKHEASFWTAEEIDLANDRYDELPGDEKHFIEAVLGFFSWADGMVAENLIENFFRDVHLAEARTFYGFQAAMEGIHAETYGLLIEHYVPRERRESVFYSLQQLPIMREKAAWIEHWMHSDRPFSERLIAFAIVEGVFFSGAFCAIFWMKKRGVPLSGLTFSNELISRDEGLHCDFACLLYDMLLPLQEPIPPERVDELLARTELRCGSAQTSVVPDDPRTVALAFPDAAHDVHVAVSRALMGSGRCTEERAHQIVREGVKVESSFVSAALPVHLIGMSAELMTAYVEFVADRLLHALGYEKLFRTENPFHWMELLSLQGKTNFFEKRVGEYQKANVMNGEARRVFATDEEF